MTTPVWGLWLHALGIEPVNAWLAYYDPDATESEAWTMALLQKASTGHAIYHHTGPNGGYILATTEPQHALRFRSHADAVAEWMRVSTSRPHRADGYPNRPLSAFTVEPKLIEEEVPESKDVAKG